MIHKESEYEKQAREFAEKCELTMEALYLGHYPRLQKDWITANYRITLTRPSRKAYSFDFSTSVHDSWHYAERFGNGSKSGLPPGLDLDKFFEAYLKKPVIEYKQYRIAQRKNTPSLYDVLACIEKRDPGTFEEFCSEFGYDADSRKAEATWREVVKEGRAVEALFSDVLDELQEIN